MSYQYNYSYKSESGLSEFQLKTYIKRLDDFLIPTYSIAVIPSVLIYKPDGKTIEYSTVLTDTTYTPLPDLFTALKFFKIAVYRKFSQGIEKNKDLVNQLERFGFIADELGLDISTNFLDESAINKIVSDLVPKNELNL
jgi:hypothetical protein